MARVYGRIHRLLQILMLIRTGPWTARQLAGELGITERSVYRDLKMLEGAGIPYHYDPIWGGYRIGKGFFLPPVDLTPEESLALVAAAAEIGRREQIPFLGSLEQAAQKVLVGLPEQLRDELADLSPRVAVDLARYGPSEEVRDVYRAVRRAIITRRALHCSYESATGDRNRDANGAETFRFDPYCLYWGQRAWYAIGKHHGRGETRTLKLNRFCRCDETEQPYVIPSDFSLARHMGKAWRMIRGDQTYQVELIFDAEFAETVTDTRWHDTQAEEWLEDGSVVLRFEVDGLDEIVWWVLSMGPHCRVRQPAELARRVRDLAAKTAAQYASNAPDAGGNSGSSGRRASKRPAKILRRS